MFIGEDTPAELQLMHELTALGDEHLAYVEHRLEWLASARPNQITPPGDDWSIWLMMAGRGFGKTRSGVEDAHEFGWRNAGARYAVIAPTYGDLRRFCFEGESGLINKIPEKLMRGGSKNDAYNRSLFELYLANGTKFEGYSSEEPERLRGPQFHRAWCDELAAWKRLRETWDMLQFTLRLGNNPQIVATTTPKPLDFLKELLREPGLILSRGSTFDNAANLPEKFLAALRRKYEGTRLGRQELFAELLSDVQGALWTLAMMERALLPHVPHDLRERLVRVVVAVDPATTARKTSDETGIIVAGADAFGMGYLLEDCTVKGSPEQWARLVVNKYHQYRADRIVGEVNNGGDLVESVIRAVDRNVSYRAVHASRGKAIRAEPIAALYEQNRVKHVMPFPELEAQCTGFVPGVSEKSPDRMDAMVWAFTDLLIDATILRMEIPETVHRPAGPAEAAPGTRGNFNDGEAPFVPVDEDVDISLVVR